MRRRRVRIVYKSGAIIDLKCEKFVVRSSDGKIVEVQWTRPRPSPLHAGVDDIAAVWQTR